MIRSARVLITLVLQPLMKAGIAVEPTEDGLRWLQKLHAYGTSFQGLITPDASAAVEECEREVEQAAEKDQELEEETRFPNLMAAGEKSWESPGAAMQLSSATEIEVSQGISVRPLIKIYMHHLSSSICLISGSRRPAQVSLSVNKTGPAGIDVHGSTNPAAIPSG